MFFMTFCVPFGDHVWDFTQYSLIFLHFVVVMSPLRHHPLILSPNLPVVVFFLGMVTGEITPAEVRVVFCFPYHPIVLVVKVFH